MSDANEQNGPMNVNVVENNNNGKLHWTELEDMFDDTPVQKVQSKKEEKVVETDDEKKAKFEANKPPATKKSKKEVEETDDELGLDEDAEEFLESLDEDDETPKKSSKKSALDLLDDDLEDENTEETDEKSEETTEEVEENSPLSTDKLDEKVLKQIYKIPLEGGQTEEVTLQNLINGYGKNKSGDKKLQDAAQMKKELDFVIGKLKDKDDRSEIFEKIISKSGDDYHEFIESEHARLLKFSMLDESDRERLIKERNDAKELKLFREQREASEKQEQEKSQNEYMTTLYNNIGTAIQEDPLLLKMQQGLTDANKTYIINKFEAFVKLIEEKKVQDPKFDISYKQIANLVKEEIKKDIKNAPKLPDEELEQLSDEQLRAVGKGKPKQIEKKSIPGVKKSNGISTKQSKKGDNKLSTWDFLRSMDD